MSQNIFEAPIGDNLNYKIVKPSAILSQFIKYYWDMEILNPLNPEPYRVIPQGCIELMFFYRKSYLKIENGNTLNEKYSGGIIRGQQSSFIDLQATGDIGIFSVLFKPQGAMMFFSLPLKELTDQAISLHDIAGKETSILEDQIENLSSTGERVQIIEKFLLKKLLEKEYYSFNRINTVIQEIITLKGEISIDEMSKVACLSSKQLERYFSKYIGMTPKQYLKIVRFQKVLKTKELNEDLSLTSLAHDCGYFDQAHFIKDFKLITGMTPKGFFQMGETHSDFF